MTDFNITWLDVLDVALGGFLLYQLYRLVKGTSALYIFGGITAIYVTWKLTEALHMQLLSEILGQFIGVGFIALIIVFQQEIRKFLLVIGSTGFGRRRKLLSRLFGAKESPAVIENEPVIQSVQSMSDKKLGALIVIERKMPLGYWSQTGQSIDAKISARLIESIFMKDGPLHDGAVILSHGRIDAASCILPVSDHPDIPTRFGLRHRAAYGLSERTDAFCIVVSEETGQISVIVEGEHFRIKHSDELRIKFSELLKD